MIKKKVEESSEPKEKESITVGERGGALYTKSKGQTIFKSKN